MFHQDWRSYRFPSLPPIPQQKAALHSYTQSLRVQLKDTPVEILELIPPAVATDLTPGRTANNPRMMSLQDYIAETMQILKTQPTPAEICVENVKFLRFAEANGSFDTALGALSLISL